MKKVLLISLVAVLILGSCRNPFRPEKDLHDNRGRVNLLDTILKRKKIIALTDYSSTNYFIYRGQPMGYQYELIRQFAQYLKVSTELQIDDDLEASMRKLANAQVDVLSMGLTVTSERKKKMLFTQPLFYTRQVLVQRKPKGYRKMATADEINAHLVRNAIDLAGKTIHIQKGAIYYQQLLNIENNIADSIHIVQDTIETEQLIAMVADGKIKYTVADEMLAKVAAKIYPEIDVKMPVSFHQKIAWAVRKDQKPLLDTINAWLTKFNQTLQARYLYNKYFKNISSRQIAKSEYFSYTGNRLSPYDDLIKKEAAQLEWDWRLLASMIYQESQFKPNVRSWVGAYGLMQLMPETMEEFKVDTNSSVAEQISAGVRLLKSFNQQLPDSIVDSVQRIKFTLASYNGGLGHVLDARRLAANNNKDPNRWDDNVDYFVLHLSEKKFYHNPLVRNGYMRGWETYQFVREIFDRYQRYKTLIKE
jgi:membrane-bound lytic murein transglycosylase F